MSLTININGLTLCHRGSNGVTHNTLPDVCKTPDKGVPVAYENEAYSRDLVKGTTTVFADGGNMIANFGSEFCKSVFDEGGSMGGVISGTHLAEASWITHSFDVFFEKKPACRLTDKMFMNHKNTVNMAGLKQRDLPKEEQEFYDELCKMACECFGALQGKLEPGQTYQNCLNGKIKEKFYDGNYPKPDSKMWREVPFDRGKGWDMIGSNGDESIPTSNFIRPNSRRLDILHVAKDGIKKLLDVKFRGDSLTNAARDDYRKIAEKVTGSEDGFEEFNIDDKCDCSEPEPEPKTVPVPEEEKESVLDKFGQALEKSTGLKLAGGALVVFFVVSEVSRLFPARNLVPVP